MTDYKYDVFISYTSANKDWVRKTFVPTLEDAGLVCIEYYRNFEVGAPIVKEMERAILESRKTILVLSPEYLGSKWSEFENLMLQTLDAANQERRLLPIIYKKCKLPPRFSYMNCVNFDNPDDEKIEWQRLFKAIGKPISEEKATQLTATRADWCFKHPYAALPNFTGRAKERQMLTDWLADEKHPLLVLRALGGFGKSALTWYWINHDFDPADWPKVVWWSFYDDREFGKFLGETLEYLTGQPANPTSTRQDVEHLLDELEKPGILLVLDGFERALRAYSSMNAAYQEDNEDAPEHAYDRDCVSPLAEYFLTGISTQPEIKSKALMTTRLCPKILHGHGGALLAGCAEEELTAMDKDDAVLFFQNLGIKGTRAEIEAACSRYGYHPLSLCLLGGFILNDFEKPKDIAVAQKKLNIVGTLKQRQHHILEQAYDALSAERQKLFSRIACFRGAIDFQALKAIAENSDTFQDDLRDFIERGLIQHTEESQQFDLHPIVRRYAYERLTGDDRTAAHTRLRDYFESVPKPERIETLDDLAPVIELYHHMVRAEQYFDAIVLYEDRLQKVVFFQFGAYQIVIELLSALFVDGEYLPKLDRDDPKAYTLNHLANAYSLNGEPRRAISAYELAIEIGEKKGAKITLTIRLENVAQMQLVIGAQAKAERNLRRALDLAALIESEFHEAVIHQELGRLLFYHGVWDEADEKLRAGQRVFDEYGVSRTNFVSVVRAYLAQMYLFRNKLDIALNFARDALDLALATNRSVFGGERDIVRAIFLLGAIQRARGNLAEAEKHLGEALRRYRAINLVEMEADILLEVAKLRYAQGEGKEASRLAGEALTITERSGYVLQGADVHLFLAELALTPSPSPTGRGESEPCEDGVRVAKEHAEAALKLAYCDGPPYYYKVAYDEAQRLLEDLN